MQGRGAVLQERVRDCCGGVRDGVRRAGSEIETRKEGRKGRRERLREGKQDKQQRRTGFAWRSVRMMQELCESKKQQY